MIEEPKNATVMEGEKVVLRCRALNDPDATTQWIKRSGDSGSTRGATANENVTIVTAVLLFQQARWLHLLHYINTKVVRTLVKN